MIMNYQAIVVGLPFYGKSSILAAQIKRSLDDGAWVFVHDPNRQFRGLCRPYADAATWVRAARAAAATKRPIARGASVGGSWSDLRALVDDLGRRFNRDTRATMPMLLAADESSLMDTSGPTFASREDTALMGSRRHRQVGLFFGVQSKTMVTDRFWSLATDVYLQAQPEDRIRELERACHLDVGALAVLRNLPPHRYVHVQPGRGFSSEPL